MFFLLQVLPVFGCLLSYDGSFEAFVVLLSREYVLSTDDIGNSAENIRCVVFTKWVDYETDLKIFQLKNLNKNICDHFS